MDSDCPPHLSEAHSVDWGASLSGSASLPALHSRYPDSGASCSSFRRRSSSSASSTSSRRTTFSLDEEPRLQHHEYRMVQALPLALGNELRPANKGPRIAHTLGQHYTTPFRMAYQELSRMEYLHQLELLFHKCDEDKSGRMDLQELRRSMRHADVRRAFSRLKVQPHQSEIIFKSLDQNRVGELTIHEFCHGLGIIVGEMPENGELDVARLRAKFKSRGVAPAHHRHGGQLAKPGGSPLLLPQVELHRAFVHSASAKAMVPGTVFNQHSRSAACSFFAQMP